MSRALGNLSEELASRALVNAGYSIVTTNFNCRGGEIDIVAREGEYLCFVEVRSRRSTEFGHPEETIGATKRHRILRAARVYLHKHGLHDVACRFDVVAIVGVDVTLLRDAFRDEE